MLIYMVSYGKLNFSQEVTMKIPLDIEVTMKDGTLILTSRVNGNTLIFAKDHIVQKKIQMVTLGELSGFTIEKIAKLFGYKTRKTYYDTRRHMMANEIQELLPIQQRLRLHFFSHQGTKTQRKAFNFNILNSCLRGRF